MLLDEQWSRGFSFSFSCFKLCQQTIQNGYADCLCNCELGCKGIFTTTRVLLCWKHELKTWKLVCHSIGDKNNRIKVWCLEWFTLMMSCRVEADVKSVCVSCINTENNLRKQALPASLWGIEPAGCASLNVE